MDEQNPQSKKINSFILIISISLFIFSLSQKCFCTERDCGEDWEGAALLISGSFGFFSCPVGFVWLANPTLLYAWIYLNKKPKNSFIASLIAFAICISFMFFPEMMVNEAGSYSRIIGYKLGYWLWTSSSLVLLIGNLRNYWLRKRVNPVLSYPY